MASADGRGVERARAEGGVMACDAAVDGGGGVDDQAIGNRETLIVGEDDAVEVDGRVGEADDVVHWCMLV